MAKKEIEIGQKCAFICENALVLYFDKAETPFVARYDLDSLAQANFEVTDKKDGLFTLGLRDYSGRSQDVGQFGNRADAHQALFTILQALLEHKDDASRKECKIFSLRGMGCMALRLFKWILMTIGALVLLYVLLSVTPTSLFTMGSVQKTQAVQSSAPQSGQQKSLTGQAGQADLSALPEGEAVDADALFAGTQARDDGLAADQDEADKNEQGQHQDTEQEDAAADSADDTSDAASGASK